MILCRIITHKKNLILSRIPSLWGQSTCSAAESWSVSQFTYLLSWNPGLIMEFKQNYEETCSFVRYSYLTSFQELKFSPLHSCELIKRMQNGKTAQGYLEAGLFALGSPFGIYIDTRPWLRSDAFGEWSLGIILPGTYTFESLIYMEAKKLLEKIFESCTPKGIRGVCECVCMCVNNDSGS